MSPTKKTVHILDQVVRSRDPEGRPEALAVCGDSEECSSTGKHGMVNNPRASTCPACVAAFDELVRSYDMGPR